MKNAALEVTRLIDDGRVELAGVPWVHPAEPTRRAEDLRTRKRSEGGDGLSHEEICSLVVQTSVFVWAPDLLFPGLKLACPMCGSQFSGARWHTPKLLHGLSSLHAYIARRYTCYECASVGSQAQRRRKEFVADAPALLDALPDYVKATWQFCSTGRTLCEATLVDFIRAMATRTSWSAIGDSINEVRQTNWAQNVTLPYYRLCVRLNTRNGNGAPAFPRALRVTKDWVRNLYMADVNRRTPEIQKELCAQKGDDVLVLDWTRDAAARCSGEWLFNVMDGQHLVLCSELTTACDPAGVKGFLKQLCDRGVKPKVIYVDDECCGAWPPVVSAVWPNAVVRLDGMHAIRRLTRTTSSTQHPWHGRFCTALSRAIYTTDERPAEAGHSAGPSTEASMPISNQLRHQSSTRQIVNPKRITAAVETVLHSFETPDKQAGALLTQETLAAWQCLRKHIAKGCLCDPNGVDLNCCGDADAAHDSRHGGVRNARGSSALEGFHTHQKAWLGPLSRHSTDAGVALLADGAQRWNRRVRGRKASAENPSSIYAPGLQQAVEAAREQARYDCT